LAWFATRLLRWFDDCGRKDLPWQQQQSAYRVWVSEIMLQQTQVTTVIAYFNSFISRFPNVHSLAAADLDEVLHQWTGLGYYARARNMHKAATMIVNDRAGEFPLGVDALLELPGIGRSTAGAIASIAQNLRAPILDGNVKRVLARFHAVSGYPGKSRIARQLWTHAETHTPQTRLPEYTQAIMDLGATICLRSSPLCVECPLLTRCEARRTDSIALYPGKKPQQNKPTRTARFFIIHDATGGCLLERRPDHGVWGGLWTPPERPAEQTTAGICREFSIAEKDLEQQSIAATFRHTFSHFHLDIEPVYLRITRPPVLIADNERLRWHSPDSNEALGLPAPAVKLLRTLEDLVAA
jgi:A/G-specific adenine glycosylase